MAEVLSLIILVILTIVIMFAIANSIDKANVGSIDGFCRSTPKDIASGGSTERK